MAKLYGAVVSDKLTAVHEDKKIIQKYCDSIKEAYGYDIEVVKISKNKINHNTYCDLYLVRYGDSYIQSKYYVLAKHDDGQFKYDLTYAKDVLLRIAEYIDDEKKLKHIKKVITTIDEEIEEIMSKPKSPIHLNELDSMLNDFNRALYKD